MKLAANAGLAGLMLLCSSCATTALWETTASDERVWIDSRKITPEQLETRCARQQVAAIPVAGGYLVEKSKGRRAADIALRAAGTPVALAIDAASGAALAGAFLFVCFPEVWLDLAAAAINGDDGIR